MDLEAIAAGNGVFSASEVNGIYPYCMAGVRSVGLRFGDIKCRCCKILFGCSTLGLIGLNEELP